jgi:hypothetical protein
VALHNDTVVQRLAHIGGVRCAGVQPYQRTVPQHHVNDHRLRIPGYFLGSDGKAAMSAHLIALLLVAVALADATLRDDEEWHAWNGSDEELELYCPEHSQL